MLFAEDQKAYYKYKDLVGKYVYVPLSQRKIPIIADEYVDKSFGTGAVKITPAHDPNDYEVGKRHGLKPIWVIDEEGKMKSCPEVHPDVQGLDRYEAREKTVGLLSLNNCLLRITEHEHNVGTCQRCTTPIAPLLSEDWNQVGQSTLISALEAKTVLISEFPSVEAIWWNPRLTFSSIKI